MNGMRNPTNDEVKFYFGVLDVLVRERNHHAGFNTSTGENRHNVDPNEFMLMCLALNPGCPDREAEIQFKHRDTRNYVYARLQFGVWRLDIPTNGPFNRGEFDKFV